MRKNLILSLIVIFTINFIGNNKSFSRSDEIKIITLTDSFILRYLNTYPDFVKIAKQINTNFQSNQSVDQALRSNAKINSFLKSKGWSKPEEFYLVHYKIITAIAWIIIQDNELPAETRKQIEQQYAQILKNYTENEKSLLKKHSSKIKEMYESLSSE